jgi:alkylated DNA repair dioxygenase AlkB
MSRVGLFAPDLPDGFQYVPDFLRPHEERDLRYAIEDVSFDTFTMRGVVARRRVKFYGATYGEYPAAPIPDFLLSLRERVAKWVGVPSDAFAMALINEYTAGATIGWHRDAPQYELVAGVSLLSTCRMKLRPYMAPKDLVGATRAPRKTTHEITLEPRSAYLLSGPARSDFEHSIPATEALRYSITFRTLR